MVTEQRHRSILFYDRGPVFRLSLIISISLAILALQLKFDYAQMEPLVEEVDPEIIEITHVFPKKEKPKTLIEKVQSKRATISKEVKIVEKPPEKIELDSVIFIEMPKIQPKVKLKPKPKRVFDFVSEMPEFPGGEESLLRFLGRTEYCRLAIENNIEATVHVQFVVDENGDVGNVKALRKAFPCLEREAVRQVKNMPRWKPGQQGQHRVKVRMHVPIKFKLAD